MIDRPLRKQLAERVRHVVSGRISKADFCFENMEVMEASPDLGVRVVFAQVEGLCDVENPFRSRYFRGSFRMAREERRRLAIAALFLYSDAEYEWPPGPSPRGYCIDGILLLACAGLLILCMALATAAFGLAKHDYPLAAAACFGGLVVGLGGAAFCAGLSVKLVARYKAEWEQNQYRVGEYDVWPFLRRQDFDAARQHPPLLCGRR